MKKKHFLFLLLFLFVFFLSTLLVTTSVPAQDPQTAAEEELETFVPTEKVSADTSVPFPVDI